LDRDLRVVVGRARRHELVAGGIAALERHLHDRRAVERQVEGLAHARVAAHRMVAARRVRHVDDQAPIADRVDRQQAQPRVRHHLRRVARLDALDHVETAGLQVGEPHCAVGDHAVGDAVDVEIARVPVVGVALDDDAVLRHALDEAEGAGAHRVAREVGAGLAQRARRHHHAEPHGKLGQQRREREF
jgi:hypothetical protein